MTVKRLWYLCAGWLLATAAHAAQPLQIGVRDDPADTVNLSSRAVLERAYKKIKVPVAFVPYPSRRLLRLLVEGEIDGNLQRIGAVAAEQPGLVQVETPVNTVTVRIYAPAAQAQVRTWQDLSGLRTVYMRGVLVIERNLPATAQRVEVGSEAELYRLVARGLADVAVAAEPAQSVANYYAKAAKLSRQDTVLEEMPLYHYLHGRHAELAPRLNAVLRAMQASGEADALRRKALKEFDDQQTSAAAP